MATSSFEGHDSKTLSSKLVRCGSRGVWEDGLYTAIRMNDGEFEGLIFMAIASSS